MKKKLMMVAVLLGALTLGACVDDNESQSVTGVREAKAKQLTALAGLYDAQAQAETTLAQAEADLKKAKQEMIEQETQEAAAKFEAQLEQIKAEAAKAVAEAQRAQSEAEATILLNASTRLKNLYDAYTQGAAKLAQQNYNLVTKQATIAGLEAGVVSAKTYVTKQTSLYEGYIKQNKALLDALNDESNVNIDYDALSAKYTAAYQKLKLAKNNLQNNEGVSLMNNEKVVEEAISDLWDKRSEIQEAFSVYDYINGSQIDAAQISYDNVYYTGYDETNVSSYSTSRQIPSAIRISEAELLKIERFYAAVVKMQADVLGTDKDDKTKDTAYGKLAAANAEKADAEKLPEKTDAEKAAKKTALDNAEMHIAEANDGLASAQKNYDVTKAESDEFAATVKALDLDAYHKEVAALKELVKTNETLTDAFEKAYAALNYGELQAEVSVLSTLLNNSIDFEQQRENAENSINYYTKAIAELKDITTAEAALAQANEEIVNLKAEIEVQKLVVANAKAALDAEVKE